MVWKFAKNKKELLLEIPKFILSAAKIAAILGAAVFKVFIFLIPRTRQIDKYQKPLFFNVIFWEKVRTP